MRWSWVDGNGQSRSEETQASVAQIAGGYRGSGALLQPDYLRELPKIASELKRIRELMRNK